MVGIEGKQNDANGYWSQFLELCFEGFEQALERFCLPVPITKNSTEGEDRSVHNKHTLEWIN